MRTLTSCKRSSAGEACFPSELKVWRCGYPQWSGSKRYMDLDTELELISQRLAIKVGGCISLDRIQCGKARKILDECDTLGPQIFPQTLPVRYVMTCKADCRVQFV